MSNQSGHLSDEDRRTLAAWDVLRARRAPSPPNPIRYSHNFKLALWVIAFTVLLAIVVFPARAIESDMRRDAEQAKRDGFPDLPPGDATDKQIANWTDEWAEKGETLPESGQILALSDRVGDYEDDSAVINLGVMGSLASLVFISAFAFVRALNNLYALGYGTSVLSPAWAFISWFLPVLNFVLPWRTVSEVVECAWKRPGESISSVLWPPRVISALWGLAYIGLALINPITVTWFAPRDDIDEWISHLLLTERMLLWLPVVSIFTALMLLMVTIKQHERYRQLDRQAAAARA